MRLYTRGQKFKVLLTDLLTLVLSFFISSYIRYGAIDDWQPIMANGLFETILFSFLLIYGIVFVIYDIKKGSIANDDPFDALVRVVKNMFMAYLLLVVFLYATHKGTMYSRLQMGYAGICSIVIDYILRMLEGWYLRQKYEFMDTSTPALVVTTAKDAYLAIRHIKEKREHKVFAKYIALLDDSSFNEVEGIPIIAKNGEIVKDSRRNDFDMVFVCAHDVHSEDITELCTYYENEGINIYKTMTYGKYDAPMGGIVHTAGYITLRFRSMGEKADVFGIHYVVSSIDDAVFYVRRHLKELSGKYVCFSNVHTTVMAREDASYRDIQNGAALTFPDGAPVARHMLRQGHPDARRCAGPDFMEEMFHSTMDGRVSHYFYGSDQKTLDKLKENLEKKYPGIDIRGLYSPPYRQLTPEEDAEDIKRINDSGADIVWIGLGAPKQEKWMAAHKDKVKGVMMGVGAGFNFHANTIKRAPYWIQKIGFEWLYRLMQDPKRLFSRYLVTNLKFSMYLLIDRISGKSQ